MSVAFIIESYIRGCHIDQWTAKNIKATALSFFDRAMLSKRFIIKTIDDQSIEIYFANKTFESLESAWIDVQSVGKFELTLPFLIHFCRIGDTLKLFSVMEPNLKCRRPGITDHYSYVSSQATFPSVLAVKLISAHTHLLSDAAFGRALLSERHYVLLRGFNIHGAHMRNRITDTRISIRYSIE